MTSTSVAAIEKPLCSATTDIVKNAVRLFPSLNGWDRAARGESHSGYERGC
ncbi:MAG: hypothetical protein SGJ09_13015 [Phycisphaerae bacterium]|nr:hypothetical protein [Phycisphaerae bacterium]